MKRLFGFAAAILMTASALFAGPFGDLADNINSFDPNSVEAVKGTLPNGRDILPLLWKYAASEADPAHKVLAFDVQFKGINPIDNDYAFVQEVTFKFGGLQKQVSKVLVSQEGQDFFVKTVSLKTYNVDSEGKPKDAGVANSKKSCNVNSKNIVGDLVKISRELKDDDYKKLAVDAYSSLTVQVAVGETAINKLKAKKWYSSHSMEGQNTTGRILVANVDESKRDGYAYMIQGVGFGVAIPEKTVVNFFTNNDDLIDVKAGNVLKISGKAVKVEYNDNGVGSYYISSIIVEE